LVFSEQVHEAGGIPSMVVITFPDRETAKRAVGFLLGRFSGRLLKTGECIVPEAALEVLAQRDFQFTVRGKATYEHQMAAIRGAHSSPAE
jgi:hypothetical protein